MKLSCLCSCVDAAKASQLAQCILYSCTCGWSSIFVATKIRSWVGRVYNYLFVCIHALQHILQGFHARTVVHTPCPYNSGRSLWFELSLQIHVCPSPCSHVKSNGRFSRPLLMRKKAAGSGKWTPSCGEASFWLQALFWCTPDACWTHRLGQPRLGCLSRWTKVIQHPAAKSYRDGGHPVI